MVDEKPGTLSFNYSGYKTGTYSATGEASDPPDYGYKWATAKRFTEFGKEVIRLYTNIPINSSPTVSDVFQVTIPDMGTGLFSLPNNPGSPDQMIFNFSLGSGSTHELYYVTSGKLQVTSSSANRIKGNFSGTASDVTSPGRTIQIINGVFDLKVNN